MFYRTKHSISEALPKINYIDLIKTNHKFYHKVNNQVYFTVNKMSRQDFNKTLTTALSLYIADLS